MTPKRERLPGDGLVPGFSNDERLGLAKIFADLLRGAKKELGPRSDPLVVEEWASRVWGVWYGRELVAQDTEAVFGGGLIDHAARQRTPEALRALRALAVVAPEQYRQRAVEGAERLVSEGMPEPPWAAGLGASVPTEAWTWFDPVDDDGLSVLIGFDNPAGVHSLGVYIDYNLRGIAKDAFWVPAAPAEAVRRLEQGGEAGVEFRLIDLDAAASYARHALARTDETLEPPISDDLRGLRALFLARLAGLPGGASAPPRAEWTEVERAGLLADFLDSAEAAELSASDAVPAAIEDLAYQVMTFSLDYVEGTPLRFSPVMVEVFCADWAPRTVTGDASTFALLSDVLRAWISFVGRRRGIPSEAIMAARSAVGLWAPAMVELADVPSPRDQRR